MADNQTKVWFITGSSTGFGRALVEAVLEQGNLVVATARQPEQRAYSQVGGLHIEYGMTKARFEQK